MDVLRKRNLRNRNYQRQLHWQRPQQPAAAHAVIGGTTDAELRAYVGKCVDQYFYQHVDHDMDVLKDNVTNEVKNRPAALLLGALTY